MTATDDLYARAVYRVTLDRKASTSFIQRCLQIGYNKAAELIERMEREGVVSQANHVGRRDILVGPPDPTVEPVAACATPPREDHAADMTPDAPATEPADEKPAPTPEPVKPARPTDGTLYTCSGCDIEADGWKDAMPTGWYEQYSAALGTLHRCPACAKKNATRIATASMSTEDIANAGADADAVTVAAQSHLRSIIERCQRLLEDISGLRGDLKEVLDEAKGQGLDVKVIRKLLTLLQKDPEKREEERLLLETYAAAINERI